MTPSEDPGRVRVLGHFGVESGALLGPRPPGAAAGLPWIRTGDAVAGRTGFEPATSGVTGQCSNQLNYRPDSVGAP